MAQDDRDEYEVAAHYRLAELNSWRAQTMANIEAYRVQGDAVGMGEEIARLAKINGECRDIKQLANQHWQSKQPQMAPELSPEMEAAKPISQMTYDDSYKLAMQSAKTPAEAQAIDAGFRQGLNELARRKAAGEI